ncbi:MAG: hypothetical protein SGJ18_12735 [Pseudomonadota bacterium]|nr:hypothetical protein [Pseudomonadota bacterium]
MLRIFILAISLAVTGNMTLAQGDTLISGTVMDKWDPYYCAWNTMAYGSTPKGSYVFNNVYDSHLPPYSFGASPILTIKNQDNSTIVQIATEDKLLNVDLGTLITPGNVQKFRIKIPADLTANNKEGILSIEVSNFGDQLSVQVSKPDYKNADKNGPLLSLGAGVTRGSHEERLQIISKLVDVTLPAYQDNAARNPTDLALQIINICAHPTVSLDEDGNVIKQKATQQKFNSATR